MRFFYRLITEYKEGYFNNHITAGWNIRDTIEIVNRINKILPKSLRNVMPIHITHINDDVFSDEIINLYSDDNCPFDVYPDKIFEDINFYIYCIFVDALFEFGFVYSSSCSFYFRLRYKI